MTLQSSGSMTIADINTELERSPTAQLSTDDSELLDMARLTSSDPITIPDDLYGKTFLGSLYGTYTVTIGEPVSNTTWGYTTAFGPHGSIDSTSYRSKTIESVFSFVGGSSNKFAVNFTSSVASDLVTAIYIVEDDILYIGPNFNSPRFFEVADDGGGGPWGDPEIGQTRTIKLYGK